MSTHVNAYKAELEQALVDAEGAIGNVRTKYESLLAKLTEDSTPKVTEPPLVATENNDQEDVKSDSKDKGEK